MNDNCFKIMALSTVTPETFGTWNFQDLMIWEQVSISGQRSCHRSQNYIVVSDSFIPQHETSPKYLQNWQTCYMFESFWLNNHNPFKIIVVMITLIDISWIDLWPLQALWRGHRVRCSIKSKKVSAARARCQRANRNVTEEKKLCNRTATALDYLLHYRSMHRILETLISLGEFILGVEVS